MAFDPSLVTFRNLEHFENVFIMGFEFENEYTQDLGITKEKLASFSLCH